MSKNQMHDSRLLQIYDNIIYILNTNITTNSNYSPTKIQFHGLIEKIKVNYQWYLVNYQWYL